MINLKYGKKFEIDRIKSTLKKLEWYKANGYRPSLPDSLEENNFIKEIDKKFNEEYYKKEGEKLISEYKKAEVDFKKKIKNILHKDLPEDIDIFVTKYGTGGLYLPPNRIIVNISGNQMNKSPIYVLKHELIHILVEDEVIKKGLSHKQKEDLVKSIQEKIEK